LRYDDALGPLVELPRIIIGILEESYERTKKKRLLTTASIQCSAARHRPYDSKKVSFFALAQVPGIHKSAYVQF